MIETVSLFWDKIGKRKQYWIPVLFFTISTYGFSVFSRTISIDDLASDYYIGNSHAMIGSGRWGMDLWPKLAGIPVLSPASDRLLATVFLLTAGILFAAMFFYIQPDRHGILHLGKYTILTCCLITYPILGEIWEYTGANYISTGEMLISIVTCYYLLSRRTIRAKELLLAGIMMTLPMSSYESGVAFYITLVCATLFYRFCMWNEKKRGIDYWKEAVLFAIPLFFALGIRWLIGVILRKILCVESITIGATAIIWGTAPFADVLRKLILDTFLNYFLNSLVYLPLTVFLLAGIFLICYSVFLTIKKRNIIAGIGGLLLIMSVFILPVVQGSFMRYRTAIPLSAFVSFSFFVVMELSEDKGRLVKSFVSILAIYVMWIQSAYLNSELSLNNQRSENEIRLMSSLAQQILEVDEEKPVIFVGDYNLGEYFRNAKKPYVGTFYGDLYQRAINRVKDRYGYYYYTFFHLTEFPDSNVNSVINWAMGFPGMMQSYLEYLGYDIHVIDRGTDPEAVTQAEVLAANKHMHSYEVMEMEDFLLVTLQLNGTGR